MDRYQLIGNIGKDADIKQFGDTQYSVFRVAVSQGKDKTKWVGVVYKFNEKLHPFLVKGKKVLAEGSPYASAYVNQEGKAVAEINLHAFGLELLSSNGEKTEHDTPIPPTIESDLPF